jgi:hypothetical protein
MSTNDLLYDGVLKPLVDAYYQNLKALADLPPVESTQNARTWYLARLDLLEGEGNRVADFLQVASPEWATMRDLAVGL